MGLLDFLSAGLTAGTQGVTAFDEGRRVKAREDEARTLAAIDRMRRERREDAELRNLESLMANRGTTPDGAPAMQYDPVRGVLVNKVTGEVVTPEGLPERPQSERAPRRQVVGDAIVNLETGEAKPIEGLPQGGDRTSAATRTQLAQNVAQLDLIRQAREAVRRRPESVGMQRGIGLIPGMGQLGEVINQRVDPAGDEVRQLIAQVSAMKIKDMSGAAVTVSEFPRLAAFVPLIWDTPEKIQRNLDQLERELLIVTQALQNGASIQDLMAGRSGAMLPQRGSAQPTPNVPSAPPDFEAWRRNRRNP